MNRPRVPQVAVVFAVSMAAAIAWSIPASAHGGPVSIELISDSATSEMARTYVVSITYDGDGDPVDDAQLTVVVEGPDGSVPPAAMTPTDTPGRFLADVTFPSPGPWTVRFTSADPVATLEVQATLPGATTTSTGSVSTVSGPEQSTAATSAPVPTTAAGSTPESAAPTKKKTSNNTPLFVGLVVVAVVVIGGLVVLRRRSAPE